MKERQKNVRVEALSLHTFTSVATHNKTLVTLYFGGKLKKTEQFKG
jgi:hypothetical protein